MDDALQVPQPGNGLGDDCRALYSTLLPFLQGVANQTAGQPNFWVGPVQTFQAPDDWVPLNTVGVATFGSGWAQWSDPNFSRCALRKEDGGECWARGLWDYIGPSGDFMVSFPSGSPFAPAAGDFVICPMVTNHTFGDVIVNSSGIQYQVGDRGAWLSLRAVRWQAKDRSPYAPHPLNLTFSVPFAPGHLLASVQETDTRGRALIGPVRTLHPRWTTRISPAGAVVLTIISCPGLTPLRRYRLTPWLLAR